jgi:hypothetical protein
MFDLLKELLTYYSKESKRRRFLFRTRAHAQVHECWGWYARQNFEAIRMQCADRD